MFVTRPPEKVTFSREKVTFSDEKMTFTILKVTFSDEKVVFSQQFSREFNRKVYLFWKACQASVSNDHLSDSNGHLSDAHCHLSAFNYTNGTVPFSMLQTK